MRISSHRLKIYTGRYLKLEVNKRLCNKCDLNQIEDEIHFLLECPSTSTDRQVLIDMINNNCNNFQYLNLSDNFFWLLNCESIDILKQLFFYQNIFLDIYVGIYIVSVWNLFSFTDIWRWTDIIVFFFNFSFYVLVLLYKHLPLEGTSLWK